MSENILPCPFCGEPGELDPTRPGYVACVSAKHNYVFLRLESWNKRPALTAAKAEARREAIEECARVCEQVHDNFGVKRQFEAATGAAVCLTEIRALSASKEG